MLKSLAKGLFGRLLGYGGLLLGFWLLREAFIEANYPLASWVAWRFWRRYT